MTLYLAALLTVGIGLVHSILGERFIISRLADNPGLPRLLGGREFTFRTLRFAWHLTTLAWFGFAAMLVMMARGEFSPADLALVIAAVFGISAVVTLVASRGRHLAWIVFLAIGTLSLMNVWN